MIKGAIVLEITVKNVVILTDDGSFLRLPARQVPEAKYVGQHLDWPAARKRSRKVWLAAVAAGLALFMLMPLFRPQQAYAWITLDSTGSLEIAVDGNLQVVEMQPFNAVASQFVAGLEQPLSLAEFMEIYAQWARGNGDTQVLVTATKTLLPILAQMPMEGVDTTLLEVSPAARQRAEELGLSVGRALLLAGAGNQGAGYKMDEINEQNVFLLLDRMGADVDRIIKELSDPDKQEDQ